MNKQPVYRFDDFVVNPEAWRLSRGGQEIHLDPVVLKLLIYLIANHGRLVTRHELMDTVWGDTVISESALTKAVARLRKALGDDSATHRYLETVRSQGYRFIAAVEEAEHLEGVNSPLRKIHARTVGLTLFAGVATIVILIIMAVFLFRAPPLIGSLAVLPLKNLTGNPEQDYFVEGLQDILITELSQFPWLRLTSRQSTLRYRNSQMPAADIARELGVDGLVEGSLLREDGRIQLTVQLIGGRKDEHIWAERYTRDTAYVFSLVADVANAIGAATMPPGIQGVTQDRMGRIDPRAIDAYALGTTRLELFTRDGIRTAIGQLEAAVKIEPKFAMAWGQLATAYAMEGLFGFAQPRGAMEKAHAAALKAVEADEQFFGGHSALGWARLWTGDFDGACESFEEVLQLNPSAPPAIHGEADCLMIEGRMDESLDRLRELVAISPYTVIDNLTLPYHLYLARRYNEAIAAATDMQARLPQFSMHWFFAKVYWRQGRFDGALEEERLELERSGDTVLLAALEEGLAADGPIGAMRAKAEALVARANKTYVDPFDIGETFARAGMVDEALHWLVEAVEHGSYKMTYLDFWPNLDILRDDPQYQDLMERVYSQKAWDIRRHRDARQSQD